MWELMQTNQDLLMEGDNSNKACFRRKTKFFRESGDFARNWETWENFSGKYDIVLGHCRKKKCKIEQNLHFGRLKVGRIFPYKVTHRVVIRSR